MTVTLGGIAGLIAALAFLYLVLRLGGLLGKAGKILDETTVSRPHAPATTCSRPAQGPHRHRHA